MSLSLLQNDGGKRKRGVALPRHLERQIQATLDSMEEEDEDLH